MAKDWINHFIVESGSWSPGQAFASESFAQATFAAPARLRIYESARSGFVMLSGSGGHCYGEPEVYLKINFAGSPYRYLSAPLNTDIEVADVSSLQLYILYSRANLDASVTQYRAYVNAHCVYEVI
jgi:hypothetical protein